MLAACGLTEVSVVRRPKVAILSTGDELVAPGETLPPAGVYDSNGAIVAAIAATAKDTPCFMGRAYPVSEFPNELLAGSSDLDPDKARYAAQTDARTLADIVKGADIFLGLSQANVMTGEMVNTMTPKPIHIQ